jgi:hypothetical protein
VIEEKMFLAVVDVSNGFFSGYKNIGWYSPEGYWSYAAFRQITPKGHDKYYYY